MKIKNIVIALLALFIAQSISATQFEVINNVKNSRFIDFSPMWRGYPGSWSLQIAPNDVRAYDSGFHHLQGIRWRLPNGWCWVANVEDVFGGVWGRVRTNVVITLYDDGRYTINLGQGEGMPRQAAKDNCPR